VHIAPRRGAANPRYIEIANLEVTGCLSSNTFTAENGASSVHGTFCAAIYARSVQHLLVRGNVLHDNHLGFYNWEGDASSGGETAYDGVQVDTVIRGNYFYDNGRANSYTEHQMYSESDGVTIEYNRFGRQKTGALGGQIKDRSAGTIIRYNWIEHALDGCDIDMVEPENGWPVLGRGSGTTNNAKYAQDFVYGNVFWQSTNSNDNFMHWNEDHNLGHGRAAQSGGRLHYYDNTWVATLNATDVSSVLWLNLQWGGYECPSGSLPGRVDVRNNIFAILPRTSGSAPAAVRFEYCGKANLDFGTNWISPGYAMTAASTTGTAGIVSPAGNDPGFVSVAGTDFHLSGTTSSAYGVGAALSPDVTSNPLGLDLTPTRQYAFPHVLPTPQTQARPLSGVGSDLGAFEH
jgi:hypothetical protein